MGIMDALFGTAPTSATATAPQPQPSQAVVQPATSIPPKAGVTDPNNTTIPPQTEETPLAQFADLWKPNTTETPSTTLLGNVDQNKVMEAVKKANFAGAVPAATLEKIAAGGQEGIAAFSQALNTVSQTVYAQSALATTKIVEQALAKQQEAFEARLPQIIKQHSVSDSLRTENPAFSNPAVQPFIQAMETQFATKYPNATSTELTAMAKQYLEGLGSLFNPAKQTAETQTTKPGDYDWDKFIKPS